MFTYSWNLSIVDENACAWFFIDSGKQSDKTLYVPFPPSYQLLISKL